MRALRLSVLITDRWKQLLLFRRSAVWAGVVYTVRLNVSCITITERGGWCGWHDVCGSNV